MASGRQEETGLKTVAVVGGGYSGTILTAELARVGVATILVEQGERFAAGAAYRTREDRHLLNVRARSMSAFAGDPEHFAKWVEAQGLGDGGTFVRRRDYHRYIAAILEEAVASGHVRLVHGQAVAAEADALVLSGGERIGCSAIVLAGGNYPSRLPALLQTKHSVDDPWSAEGVAKRAALAALDSDVLLLGTGLTMVDVALSLDSAGFKGRIVATSRRGLVPRAHEKVPAAPLAAPAPAGLLELARWLRAAAPERGWRAAVDALRPVTRDIWQALSLAEKKRFLRHGRPWWDVHRHRIAPQAAARVAALRADGRLEVVAGRITALEGGEVRINRRGGGETRAQVASVVNCTGPEGSIGRVGDPLIRRLLESGTGRPDPLGIALDVDAQSRLVTGDGTTSPNLYALGPLTRGVFWEMVAVPDIRGQAQGLAALLANR
ncbi:MAG TPA: FAD/NAD(P)-binding protein [Allosphingosinicella sp.]